jgi:hypothetical protein
MADNRGPLRRYLRNWGRPLWGRVRILSYEDVGDPGCLVDGAYVFCDVDRLPPLLAAKADAVWESLAKRGGAVRLLNRPGALMSRYQLLRALSDAGLNSFNVFRLDEINDRLRYPVFLRDAIEHTGTLSPLLADRQALEESIDGLLAAGSALSELLVVEYVDTSIDGMFRKYAGMRVGETIIAHHIMFAREWMVKGPSLVSPEMVVEERVFQKENPHRGRIAEVFRLAGVDYGRIDYGLVDGRMQVWEVNTNPTLLYPVNRYAGSQMEAKRWFAARLNQALGAVDDRGARPRVRDRLSSYRDLYR